ncbi:MAG: DUF5979 domain-containing protein [Eubacteriales bacterium]|nr:DUF5979 domain-containing protein [Eubacteriales bacterium]
MKKTWYKKLLAVAAATVMTCSMSIAALADQAADATATAQGENNVAVKIQKHLHIANGITTPNATFTFSFTAKDSTSVAQADVPALNNATVAYTAADTTRSGDNNEHIVKQSENIFAAAAYTQPGEYIYGVKEEQTGFTANAQATDRLTYDQSEYDMHVIVKQKTDKSGYYISSVYFKRTKDETGAADNAGAKKDPGENGNGSATYELFNNTYTKDAGKEEPNDPTPDANKKSLTISKTVEGAFGDKSRDFEFTLTVNKPHTETAATVDAKKGADTVTVTYGTPTTFKLKHGESLTFDRLPAGANYTLVETGTKNYKAKMDYKENGEDKTVAEGAEAASATATTVLIGEKTNDNRVTNTFQDNNITPTGLLINNLPFILMIIGAIALIGFTMISKRRFQD